MKIESELGQMETKVQVVFPLARRYSFSDSPDSRDEAGERGCSKSCIAGGR
jgi:hypothetical protein